MPRSLRIQYPGAHYHVMARGNRRENIFVDDADRRFFLHTLSQACGMTGWCIHAWVAHLRPRPRSRCLFEDEDEDENENENEDEDDRIWGSVEAPEGNRPAEGGTGTTALGAHNGVAALDCRPPASGSAANVSQLLKRAAQPRTAQNLPRTFATWLNSVTR